MQNVTQNPDRRASILAVDIGGTKIAVGVVDADGRVHQRHEVATPVVGEGTGAAIVARAVEACRAVLRQSPQPVAGIGIATGGDVDVLRGEIAYATPLLPGWAGTHLRAAFEAEFGWPTRVDNDGNCAALAEVRYGAGIGFSHALTMIVGTGIGAGYVVDGTPLRGAQGGALNPGQILLPDGQQTYEAQIASGALSRRYGESIQAIAARVNALPALPDDVATAADQLGQLTAACAAILDPNCIVIAGSILLLGERFLERARRTFREQARPPHQALPLRRSGLDANAGLIGAACLFR